MTLRNVSSGRDVPHEINVVIEIPAQSDPVKYEIDEESEVLFVDRFMSTSMRYPCNYGYIPQTLAEDGDAIDVLVICPFSLMSRTVVRCRPIGILNMVDEAGSDYKLLAVPINELTPLYKDIASPKDISPIELNAIRHFFEHYKDLEPNKWVKINGWSGPSKAKVQIKASIKRFKTKNAPEKNKK